MIAPKANRLGRALLGQVRYAEAATESLAGYEIVAKKSDPGVSWLRAARLDLVRASEATGDEESATRFRAEQAALESPPSR